MVIGKALAGRRDKVQVATKFPTWLSNSTGDYRRCLDEQLRRLKVEYIDFYHFHGLDRNRYQDQVLRYKLLDEAHKAKEQGLIKHLSFSFHDKPEVLKQLVDEGWAESVLCQYNLITPDNAKAISYARRKGLGVAVMGPVGGGRLGGSFPVLQGFIPETAKSMAELALRFVWSHPDVDLALSGMSSLKQLEENVATAERDAKLSAQEQQRLRDAMNKAAQLSELYCTGCDYCAPCPKGVKISKVLSIYITHRVYGLAQHARKSYRKLPAKYRSEQCVGCGECEKKCPQHLPIRTHLKAAAAELGEG
jgi:hypothetical protein